MDRWERLCSRADTESKILSRFEDNGLSLLMKQAVLKEVVKPSVKIYDLEDTVYNSVISSNLHVQLKNAVYKELFVIQDEVVNTVDVPPTHLKEPVDFVREAQEKWEDKLKQAINKLCTDYKVVLSQLRPRQEAEVLRKRWNSIGADYPGSRDMHPIYGPKDFLGVILQVRDPNYTPIIPESSLDDVGNTDVAGGSLQTSMNVMSLYRLRDKFKSLHPLEVQVEAGSVEYIEKSNKVLKNGLWSLAKELCKTGCPVGHRRELWCRTLALDTTEPEHAFHYEDLKSAVLKYALIFEKVIVNDVKRTAANDDNYFVFEDVMHQTLFCFLHDSSLIQHFQHLSPTPLDTHCQVTGQPETPDSRTVYPPSGVVPFHGFSLYIAPLCFLFNRPDHLYALFKQLYLRFFVHLHSLSSHPQGILSLCCQFESLLQCREPELFKHLKHINAEPVRLAFLWLMSAFSGYLDSREVLLLWDRVIGHNSLTVIAVMAVAIFEFRAMNLLKATTYSEAEDILTDLRCVKVLPLLQQTLFL